LRFNAEVDAEFRMWLDSQFRIYSKRSKLHLLFPNLQVMLEDDLGIEVPMDDPRCELTADALAVQQIYKLTCAAWHARYGKEVA
jgi:hypothetical protein